MLQIIAHIIDPYMYVYNWRLMLSRRVVKGRFLPFIEVYYQKHYTLPQVKLVSQIVV